MSTETFVNFSAAHPDEITSRGSNGRYWAAIAVVITTLVLIAQIVWLSRNRAPMLWDDSMYAAGAIDLFDGLEATGLPGLAKQFIHGPAGAKPPLICLLPLPFFLVFGRGSRWAFYAVELLSFAVICLASYRMVRRMSNGFGALAAVALLCLTPSIVGLTRQFLVEVPLLAAVVLWYDRLLLSDFLEQPGEAMRLGLILGAGMLLKITFPLFILGSVLAGIGLHAFRSAPRITPIYSWKELAVLAATAGTMIAVMAGIGGFRGYVTIAIPTGIALLTRRVWFTRILPVTRQCFTILAVGYLIAGLWYAPNLRPLAEFAWSTSFGETAIPYDKPLTKYIAEISSFGVSNLQLLLLAVAAVFLLRHRPMRQDIETTDAKLKAAAYLAIFLWLAVPLPVFLTSHDRIVRLTLPCLAAVPIAGGLLAAKLYNQSVRVSTAWLAACLILGGALFSSYSFGVGPIYTLRSGPWVFWAKQLDWDQGPPNTVGWPHRSIIRAAADVLDGINERSVFLLTNQPQLNWLNLKLSALQERVTADFDYAGRFSELDVASDVAQAAPLILTEEGGDRGPEWTQKIGNSLTEMLRKGALGHFKHVYEMPLPDDGTLHFYQKIEDEHALSAHALPRPNVVFDDRITLVGLDLRREEQGLRWRAQWKATRYLERDYSVYVHFVDDKGHIFPKDHSFLINGRTTTGINEGETFFEDYLIPLTADVRGLHVLRVGVYEFATLTKLPVTGSNIPLVDAHDGILLSVPEPAQAKR